MEKDKFNNKEQFIKELEKREKFLNDVLDSILDGISILDKDMNIVRVNKAMEEWYSHAMPVVGKKCYEAYHGRNKICDVCPSRKTLEMGKSAYEVVPKTGTSGVILGWLDLFTFPWVDAETRELNGVIEYVRDITERKKMEEELNKKIQDLEKFYEMAIGREMKMKDLKEEIKRLKAELANNNKK